MLVWNVDFKKNESPKISVVLLPEVVLKCLDRKRSKVFCFSQNSEEYHVIRHKNQCDKELFFPTSCYKIVNCRASIRGSISSSIKKGVQYL